MPSCTAEAGKINPFHFPDSFEHTLGTRAGFKPDLRREGDNHSAGAHLTEDPGSGSNNNGVSLLTPKCWPRWCVSEPTVQAVVSRPSLTAEVM